MDDRGVMFYCKNDASHAVFQIVKILHSKTMLCNWLGYASAHQQVGVFQEKRGLGEGRRYETIL